MVRNVTIPAENFRIEPYFMPLSTALARIISSAKMNKAARVHAYFIVFLMLGGPLIP